MFSTEAFSISSTLPLEELIFDNLSLQGFAVSQSEDKQFFTTFVVLWHEVSVYAPPYASPLTETTTLCTLALSSYLPTTRARMSPR